MKVVYLIINNSYICTLMIIDDFEGEPTIFKFTVIT